MGITPHTLVSHLNLGLTPLPPGAQSSLTFSQGQGNLWYLLNIAPIAPLSTSSTLLNQHLLLIEPLETMEEQLPKRSRFY